ncbi:hypothetical protein [Propionivibrio sp.]|uniref:hypothetical protein n=1 Tax=Propionivibrio sp. TaxID=2212460 RepID=UPI003BF3EEC6
MAKKNAPNKKSAESAAAKRTHSNPPADLFPESLPHVLAAIHPTAGTRAGEALQALKSGPQNQADYWHGWRLAAYVRELIELGWVFIKRDISKPGCRRSITEYSLDHVAESNRLALASRQKGSISIDLSWGMFTWLSAVWLGFNIHATWWPL